jgi:hypothetical protein
MKYILHTITFTLVLAFFASCTPSYHAGLITSTDANNEQKQFTYANDSLLVTYRFAAYPNKVIVNVFNKTDHPIFIQPRYCTIASGNTSNSMITTPSLNLNTEFISAEEINKIVSDAVVSGNTNAVPIFPQTEWQIETVLPQNFYFKTAKATSSKKELVNIYDNNQAIIGGYKFKAYEFEKEHTPLTFKVILAIVNNTNNAITSTISNEFYIYKIWDIKSNIDAWQLSNLNQKQGLVFRIK